MSKNCTVIIDAQKDFTNPGFAYAKRHPSLNAIAIVAKKLDALLRVTAPERGIIVCSSYQEDQFGDGFAACIPGTEGHRISLRTDKAFVKFEKTGHSCFSSKAFSDHLVQQQVTGLLLCGFLTEYCVKATALDALAQGYRITICPDLVGSADEKQAEKEQALQSLQQQGARIYCPEAAAV